MKKIKYFLVLLISIFFIGNVNAQDIKEINMDIKISSDGTAHITENWIIKFDKNEDLTEVYKPYYNLGNSEFQNFKASLNNHSYTYIDNWDIDEDFNYKKYKNGFNYTDNGIELCWGISEKGKTNNYKITYDITNFVAKVSDADMVYWTLVPKNLNDSPEKTYIKIHSDFKYYPDLPVWGYGNLGGYAYVYDGYIEMSSDGALDSDEYMTILVKFPKDTFTTDNTLDENFDYYLDMANEGATSYEESSSSSSFFDFLIPFIIIFVAISGVFIGKSGTSMTGTKKIKFGKTSKKLPKEVNYFRDIPCNKDIYKAYWISKTYKINKKDTDLLGAVLLKWINEGKIEIKKDVNEGIFKKEKSSIILKQNLEFELYFEKELYNMLYEASLDGVLEAKEFKIWSNDHYTEIYNWFSKILDFETEKLESEGKLVKLSRNKYETTDLLLQEATELKGLKKFLEDFSRIYEKNPIEVHLWQEYLIFAQIFGIAEKVAKDFKDIYPDMIPDDYIDDFNFIYFVSYTGMNSASSAKSRAESYDSGGGGFSSGGGGFGSFGGGGFGGGGGR